MPERILDTVDLEAAVQRDGAELVFALSGRVPGPVSVFPEGGAEAIGTLAPGERLRVGLPMGSPRPLFTLAPEGAPSWRVAERLLPLRGAQNFRDLGGYPAADGRRVAWGHVYRADTLAELDGDDRALLRQLGVRTVIDLRHDDEVEDAPNALAGHDGFAYRREPLGNRNVDPKEWRDRFERGDIQFEPGFLSESYKSMLDECGDTFARIYGAMAAAGEGMPAVFHCTAGKDRTGVTASLLLLLLGVPESIVLGDYALTGVFTENRIRGAERYFRERGIDPEVAAPLMASTPDLLATALDHLHENYGSAERYLREKAGVSEGTIAVLRERLLE